MHPQPKKGRSPNPGPLAKTARRASKVDLRRSGPISSPGTACPAWCLGSALLHLFLLKKEEGLRDALGV